MNKNRLTRLGEILEENVKSGHIAGGNVAVMYKGEEIYYAEAGYADIANGKKIARDSIFRLYSMSKPITAAAVMLLVERGVLDMLDPIAKFIPTFEHMTIATSDGDVQATKPITVKDCMGMTSGLPYGTDPDVASQDVGKVFDEMYERLYTDNQMSTVEFALKLGNCRLDFEPGTAWRYGTSADVLGAVVEVATGMRFGDFLQKEFFEPLGMEDTGFGVPADKLDRLTVVYEETPEGLIEYHDSHLGIINHMDKENAFQSGGAGLVSTIADYERFTQMLMNGGSYDGRRYLAPRTVEYLTHSRLTPQQSKNLEYWENLAGFTYGNLMRILDDPAKAVINGSVGEYGWDGWLGPYFANIPQEDLTMLLMIQRKDTGTFDVTRKLRNVLASAIDE